MLGAASYRVGDATVIEDENGNKLSFAEVPSIADGASQDAAAVYFEASDEESADAAAAPAHGRSAALTAKSHEGGGER